MATYTEYIHTVHKTINKHIHIYTDFSFSKVSTIMSVEVATSPGMYVNMFVHICIHIYVCLCQYYSHVISQWLHLLVCM